VSRLSQPYVEIVAGQTSIRAGERVERDDGWWRAVRVMTWRPSGPSADGDIYQSEIEWRPIDAPTSNPLMSVKEAEA
jgi:hypothetical protein